MKRLRPHAKPEEHKSEVLGANDFIRSVGADSFVIEVLKESRPVLVICMDRDCDFQGQINIIEGIRPNYGERVKACLIEEEFTAAFKEKVNIKGTPTFVIYIRGTEKGRMLGRLEQQSLEDFLSQTLSHERGRK